MPVTSPRRCSIVLAAFGDKASAAAATSSDANKNARSGSKSITSNLDPDDLADPEESDDLHDQHGDQHRLAHLVGEQHLHVLGIDIAQYNRERWGQRQEDEGGEAAVRRMDP